MTEFIRLCDVAISRAEEIRRASVAAGDDSRAGLAERGIDVLRTHRRWAETGSVPRRSDGFGFGPTRFVSDYEWGPDGGPFVDAVYALEAHWAERT